MVDTTYLEWPFLEPRHAKLARELDAWASRHVSGEHGDDLDAECRSLVRALGEGGWLKHAVALEGEDAGGRIDTRALCLMRETLARHSGLADFAFGMQGLGSGAISIAGSAEQRQRYLPGVVAGKLIPAFALSEPNAGSDVGAMECSGRIDGDHVVINGEKSWISNGGIADFYALFVRTGEAEGSRGISAFIVETGTPGFEVSQRIDVIAPHPLARLRFTDCRVPLSQRIGAPGEGFKVAMRTLGVFRPPAAALGFARGASSGQRNCFLSILPTEVRGKASTNTIWRGTL